MAKRVKRAKVARARTSAPAAGPTGREVLRRYSEQLDQQRDAIARLKLSKKRMEVPPPQRMRWVLDFIAKDLALLHAGEREALGYDLRGLAAASLPKSNEWRFFTDPMPDNELRDYQKTIRDGLAGLLADEPRAWTFDATPRLVVVDQRRRNRRRFAVQFGGPEAASVIGGVAWLVSELGERLRRCAECGAPFVAERKEEYCTASHAQRARNKRRPNPSKEKS